MKKTNAARILDKINLSYQLKEFTVDKNDMSAENAAEQLGVPLSQVFKTLVTRGDKVGIIVACIPGGSELDLKSLAKLSGNKKVEMVPVKELPKLTGYEKGAVSPLGMKKNYPVYLDESAYKCSFILLSAGMHGVQLSLAPQDLVKALQANTGKIAF